MASDVADLRALLERAALPECEAYRDDDIGAWHVRRVEVGDCVAEIAWCGHEPLAQRGATEARAQIFAAIPTTLPAMLDRTERMEAELRDLGQRAEAAQCALVDEQIAASEARRPTLANDRLRQVAEGERDLLRVQAANATEKCDTLRSDLDEICGYATQLILEVSGKFPVREVLGAAEGERLLVAARRVVCERDVAAASVQQLRADVELATAQRDAETCRADNAEAQLAAVTGERGAEAVENDAMHDLIVKQAGILTAVADALKGTPPALMTHSHHDLGAVAAATVAQQEPLVTCVDAFRAAARAAGWHDADATGESLVAWVRRGALREALAVARTEPGVPIGATQADFNAAECAGRIAAGIEKLMGGE